MPFGRQLPCKWPAIGRQLAGNWPPVADCHTIPPQMATILVAKSGCNWPAIGRHFAGQIGLHLVCKNKSKDLFHEGASAIRFRRKWPPKMPPKIGSKFAPKMAAIWCAKINLKIYFTRVLLPYDSAANGHRNLAANRAANCQEIIEDIAPKSMAKRCTKINL